METDYALKETPDPQPIHNSESDLLEFAIKYARYLGFDYKDPDVVAGILSKLKIGR